MGMDRVRKVLAAVLLTSISMTASSKAARERLELRSFQVPLPGAPAVILPADLDHDGLGDLVVVVAFTEWSQIVTEETLEMDQVDGLVEMMTIVPALTDHREILAFRGLPSGGFEAIGAPLALDLDVISVFRGPAGVPVVALTDHGVSELRLYVDEGQPRLTLVPFLERRSVLSFSGSLLSDLELIWDFDGDGLDDLLFPSLRTLDVFLSTSEGLASTPVAETALERASMTPCRVDFSCDAKPLTVSTRLGIRSWRRFNCTSICDQAFLTWFFSRTRPL